MTDQATWKAIGPAPREVPPALRLQWLVSQTTAVGGFILAVGLAVMVLGHLSARPLAQWRLARAGREAAGGLIGMERTNYTENDHPVYRCRYVFRTPDGVERQGTCFTLGSVFRAPPAAAVHDPRQRPRVTVEYDAGRPEVSRIKGQRVGALGLPFLVFPLGGVLAGLAITWYGLARGARRLHLLEHGALAHATLVSARLNDHEARDNVERPFAEFRQRQLARQAGDLTAADVLPENARKIASASLKFWTAGVVLMFGFGVVFIVGIMVALATGQLGAAPINGQPADRMRTLCVGAAFLVVWVCVGAFMLRVSRKSAAFLSGQAALPAHSQAPPFRCTFGFQPPGSEPVRASETLPFDERLGAEPTEPVLYDPDRPSRALLLNGVRSSVAVAEFGGWQPTETVAPWLRLVFVLACLVALPWGAWVLWHAL